MNEMIRIHDCATGQIIDRPRTDEEQAVVDAERVTIAAGMEANEREMRRRLALAALQEQQLAEAAQEPGAPQAVKDYAEGLEPRLR